MLVSEVSICYFIPFELERKVLKIVHHYHRSKTIGHTF
jgi:hypothetical protein